MNDIVIDISAISKRYSLSHRHRPDSIKAWLRSLVANNAAEVLSADEEFWALKNISLQIRRGECLALVGKNGSGKSTLLKILSRIIPPTSGNIRVRGRMASLLEVGTGFHPELTGRENVFLNGAMIGCSEQEIRRQFDSIVEFSGVEKFLDTPVKHYSSGMYVRLAYSVAAHVGADILIIDEVLAVGDADFQKKCIDHLKHAIASGTSAIVVSHSIPIIKALASQVVWLQGGQVLQADVINSGILESYIG